MDLYGKLRTMDVLVIDDDPWMRDALTMFFGVEGVRCTSVGSIGEGAEEIRKRKFGLIFCKYWMEGTDGLAFLKLSRISQPDAVRILVATFVPVEALAELKEERSVRFLHKPIRVETMEMLIGEELSRRNPAIDLQPPPSGGTRADGNRMAPGSMAERPLEDRLGHLSFGRVRSRKGFKGKKGGPPHGEGPVESGIEEASRSGLSRKG